MEGRSNLKATLIALGLGANCLFGVFWQRLAEHAGLSMATTGVTTAIHEFLCSILVFVILRMWISQEPRMSWLKSLRWSFLFVAIADLAYGYFQYIVRTPPGSRGLLPLFHEAPYVAFSLLLAASSWSRSRQGLLPRERLFTTLTIGALAGVHFYASYQIILLPFFHAVPVRPIAIYTTAFLYAVGQSIFFGSLLIASIRTRSTLESAIWFLLLTLAGSDFALRFQDIGESPVILSIFEKGWEFALAGVASLLCWRACRGIGKSRRPVFAPLMPLYSLRVLTALLTLVTLVTFFVAIWAAPAALAGTTPGTLGGHILNFLLVWGAANLLSLSLSRGLSTVEATLRLESKEKEDVPARPMLAELESLFQFLNSRNLRLQEERDRVIKLTSTVTHNLSKPLQALYTVTEDIDARRRAEGGDYHSEATLEILKLTLSRIRTVSEGVLQERKRMKQAERIREAIENATALAQLKFPDRNFEIIVPDGIDGVELPELGSVLLNLIENAAEASKPSQTVTVVLSNLGRAFSIEVRDQGSGMGPGLLTQIRRGNEITTKANGNGLGLSYVTDWASRNLVEFTLESSIEAGTIARLFFSAGQG